MATAVKEIAGEEFPESTRDAGRGALIWRDALARVGHYVDEQTATTVYLHVKDRSGPLILEGPPGGGKTSLAQAVADVFRLKPYWLECFKSVGKREALYTWNDTLQQLRIRDLARQGPLPKNLTEIIYSRDYMVPGVLARALMDPHPNTCVIIDELDKVPQAEAFEAMLLRVLQDFAISIPETGETIRPASRRNPLIFITSNAGVEGSNRSSLSHPVLRRGRYIYVPAADRVRQYKVLREAAPSLAESVIIDAVLLVERLSNNEFDKPVALSETIMWARSLALMAAPELSQDMVLKTMAALTKSQRDATVLREALKEIFVYVRKHREKFRDELWNRIDEQV